MSSWCSCAPPSLGVCSVCAVPCFFVSFKLSHFSCNGNRNKNKAVNLENKSASLLPFHLNFSVPAVVSGTQHSLYNAAWYRRAGTGQLQQCWLRARLDGNGRLLHQGSEIQCHAAREGAWTSDRKSLRATASSGEEDSCEIKNHNLTVALLKGLENRTSRDLKEELWSVPEQVSCR